MVFRSPDRFVYVLALALIGGCQVGTITAPGYVQDDSGGPPLPTEPDLLFATAVQPLLNSRCARCHTDEVAAPVFLEGDYYASVLSYPGLVLPGNPGGSGLLTKGAHAGPAWAGNEAATIAAWIDVETGEVDPPGPGVFETIQITIDEGGVNQIPLDSLGMPGSSIQFNAAVIASGMRLTNVELVGGTGGAAVSGPRFIMHTSDGMEIPDDDRFSSTSLRAIAGQRDELISAMVLAAYPTGGTLSIRFASAMQME